MSARGGPRRRGAAILAALGLPLALASCSDHERAGEHHPLVVVGFDGLEWSVARPLVESGRMPNLRGLIDRGVSGYLYTRKPAKSPVIWTTIATGKRPEHHLILDFLSPSGVPYTSESRRGKALWNIASDYGLETLTVGWWVTWPAEEVNGRMVAPYSAAGQNVINWKGNFYEGLEGQTWPPELLDEVLPLAAEVAAPDEVARLRAEYFGDAREDGLFADRPAAERDAKRAEVRKLIGQLMWSVLADETYKRVALDQLSRGDFPDLTMLYFGGPDVASHRFWRYMSPAEFQYEVDADAVAMLGDVIARFYERADATLGEVLARLPADANVIVCSDHGFHAQNTAFPDPMGVSGHHLDGPPGILVAAGPDFRSGLGADRFTAGGRLLDAGWVDDVHPVALHLLGIPVGRDVEDPTGGPLAKTLVESRRVIETGPSHDEGFRAPLAPRSGGDEFDGAIKDWMAQNGYLSGDGGGNQRVGPGDRAPGGPGRDQGSRGGGSRSDKEGNGAASGGGGP